MSFHCGVNDAADFKLQLVAVVVAITRGQSICRLHDDDIDVSLQFVFFHAALC